MKKIEEIFKNLDRTALINFIMAGDPDMETTLNCMHGLVDGGCDIIELGMPFTDPVADGETIQHAGIRALKNNPSLDDILDAVRKFRADNSDTPVILMGYFNPIHLYGMEKFASAAKEAGVDGFIIVDLPPEESAEFSGICAAQDLDFIRLVTPTTDVARLSKILEGASGFLYYVSITGVTGAAKPDPAIIGKHIEEIKSQTDLPIAIGFGIKTSDDAKEMAAIADGIVVGSAIVKTIGEKGSDAPQVIQEQVKSLSKVL